MSQVDSKAAVANVAGKDLDALGEILSKLGQVVSLTHDERVGGFYTLDLIRDGMRSTGIGDTARAALQNAQGKAHIMHAALALVSPKEAAHA